MLAIKDIREFLSAYSPFRELPVDILDQLAGRLKITYHKQGDTLLDYQQENHTLFVIRKGSVSLHDPESGVLEKRAEGDCFGYPSLITGKPVRARVEVAEDLLVYEINVEDFTRLKSTYRSFARFFSSRLADHLAGDDGQQAMPQTLASLISGNLVTAHEDASIIECTRVMKKERVSCLLICDQHGLKGIFTDRDLRNRVVAEGVDIKQPVISVMTQNPVFIDESRHVSDALLMMMRHNIHHLPVKKGHHLVGLVSAGDLYRMDTGHPVFFIADLMKKKDMPALKEHMQGLSALFLQQVESDAAAVHITRVMTRVTDALTRRLIELAQDQLGPAPMRWCWLAFGSQGRNDQSLKTDQDNGLILEREASIEEASYFESLATRVCDGLDACGYRYCPGEIMAKNARWRLPLEAWKNTYKQWISSPDPKAVMHSSIFFDCRAIYGDTNLADELANDRLSACRNQERFLRLMTENALTHRPPLGFFRQFIVEENGAEESGLNLKHRGVVPITDLARIHALEHGVNISNTVERIEALMSEGYINNADGKNLLDALELIAMTRLRHQAQCLVVDKPADNYLEISRLSALSRNHLKAAFTVVRNAQAVMRQHYHL